MFFECRVSGKNAISNFSKKKKVLYFYAIKMNSRFGKAKTYIVDIRVGKSYFILFHPIPLYTCIINAYLLSRIYTVVKKNSILYSNYLSHALQRRPGVKLVQHAS